ncbi:hypothetical protein B0H17DRAFT_1067328, partial [Mycena rosella]
MEVPSRWPASAPTSGQAVTMNVSRKPSEARPCPPKHCTRSLLTSQSQWELTHGRDLRSRRQMHGQLRRVVRRARS